MSNNTLPSAAEFILDVREQVSGQFVANYFPTIVDHHVRLAIVGDRPNGDDLVENTPFAGSQGKLLFGILGRMGIAKAMTYCGYMTNAIGRGAVPEASPTLLSDLTAFRPNVILCLGADAFTYFASMPKAKVSEWRGTIMLARRENFNHVKIISTYHPWQVFKNWDTFPLFTFDVKRAVTQAGFPDYRPPQRTFDLSTDFDRARLNLLSLEKGRLLSLDIEGGVKGMSCISFSQDPLNGFIIPWNTFTLQQQCELAPLLAAILGDPAYPKVLQNSLYDNFVLAYAYKMPIRGVVHDTMLSAWEIYPELPKALGVQASIYTEEPYYKGDRLHDNPEVFWTYCCRDSAVTLEIHQRHMETLKGPAMRHYLENVAMLEPTLYMEMRGIAYDKKAADAEEVRIRVRQGEIQDMIDKRAGHPLNLNSPKQVTTTLYKELGYPAQHPIDPETRKIDRTKLTADGDALLELMKKDPDDPFIAGIMEWRTLDKLKVAVATGVDPDGRVRCAYNIVGTETGRYTCYTSPTGSGFNLQTVTNELRVLYRADPGMSFFQLDLAGADGWTVAAHCKLLGDPTMFDDYMAGIKPAKVIALMYKHGLVVNEWSREKLAEMSRGITEKGPEGWLYVASKKVQHGTNYGLGKNKMSDNILKDSYKKQGKMIVVSPTECIKLQHLYLARYKGVPRWQNWVKDQVRSGSMSCASGHVRRFFGRYDAHTTYMEALAHEPQANTTCATNRAMLRLWRDPDNNIQHLRSENGARSLVRLPESVQAYVRDSPRALIIEPLHQVHDALCGQFPTHLAEWCCDRLRTYFDNPLTIAGQQITIPFDGGYGPSWGECKTPI